MVFQESHRGIAAILLLTNRVFIKCDFRTPPEPDMNKLNGFTALGLIERFCFTFSFAHVKTFVKYLSLCDIQRLNTFTDFFIILKKSELVISKSVMPFMEIHGTDITIFYIGVI